MFNVLLILGAFILIILLRITYYILTLREHTIFVKKKFKINKNDDEILKLFDDNKIEYLIKEDILMTKNKCYEMWDKIEEGKAYKFRYYGFNLPLLDMNYKIVDLIE